MSGRAGRRGLDDKGIVILMIDEKVTPTIVKSMVLGKADPINSAFHLTYNMVCEGELLLCFLSIFRCRVLFMSVIFCQVLNLLRVEEINPEYMLERSFFQFQNQAAIPDLIDSEY